MYKIKTLLMLLAAPTLGFSLWLPLAPTASISPSSVTFGSLGVADSWGYTANASWTDSGLASYDSLYYTCYYYDAFGALVTSINIVVAPTAKFTTSPVADLRSGTYNGTQSANTYYDGMNPRWKSRIKSCYYTYRMEVSVGDDANEGSSGVSDQKIYTSATFAPL